MLREILYDFGGYNVEIFQIVNHLGNVWLLPQILEILSDFFRIWDFAFYYLMACITQYRRLKNMEDDKRLVEYRDVFDALVYMGICYAFFGFTYAVFKFSINLPRPYCSMPIGSFITILDTSHERCLSSFPSAHVGLACMMAIFAWQYVSNIRRICMILLILAVAFARIVLAMHYPADILYSICVVVFIVEMSKLIFAIFSNNLIAFFRRKIYLWCFDNVR